MVRVWQGLECVPHRLLSAGGFDDPLMMALEQRITEQPHPGTRKLGSNSRAVLRKLSQLISAYVDLGNVNLLPHHAFTQPTAILTFLPLPLPLF